MQFVKTPEILHLYNMSQFLPNSSDYHGEHLSEIDFSSAIKLPQQGSVCEVYKTRWQRRTVLVKRLKPEFRDSPLHLDALEKEYEIGVNLSHPYLPTYLAFCRDYIVMEYIDGNTLAELLSEDDPWLMNGKNQLSFLRSLAEVISYLHRHKVVHCDIKPDNILLTANGYNPVLVDFDKCYTDTFNDTSGHPEKFGLPADNPGRLAMDFRGLANVAESLVVKFPTSESKKIKSFIVAARDSHVTSNSLKKILEDNSIPRAVSLSLLAMGMTILVGAIAGFVFFQYNENGIAEEKPVQMQPQAYGDTLIPSPASSVLHSASPSVKEEELAATEPEISVKTQEQLHQEARARAGVLDDLIAPRYKALNARLDRLIQLKFSDLSGEQLLDSIRAYADFEEECFQETHAIMQETFPPMSEREEARVLAYSQVYTGYNRRSVPELAEIGRLIRTKMAR